MPPLGGGMEIIMNMVRYSILFIIGVVIYGVMFCVPISWEVYIDYWNLAFVMVSDGYFPVGKFMRLILFPGICSYASLLFVKGIVIAYQKNDRSLDKMISRFVEKIYD